MRRATRAGIAAGLALAACPALPATAASYGLVFPASSYPTPYVSIAIDDPETSSSEPDIDVGAGDFTIEMFVKADPGANTLQVSCSGDRWWPGGAVLIDRSRGADEGKRSFGLSISRTRVVFGVTGPTGAYAGACGTRDVADGFWHHVAVQRRAADGRMTIWVDGTLDAAANGPSGDISYPDDAIPPIGCGNCTQDSLLLLGGKQNQSAASFVGSIDELRFSDSLRYTAPFARPDRAFVADPRALALYHFDEGSGSVTRDSSRGHDATFGQDAATKPRWVAGSPFAALPGSGRGGSTRGATSHPGDSRTTSSASPASPEEPGGAAGSNVPADDDPGSRRRADASPPKSAFRTAMPVAGGVAALGFFVAMIVLGMRAAQRA